MKSTKWIKIFFGLSLIGVLFVGGFNYLYDRYSIFDYNTKYYSEEPNQNFIKMSLLLNKVIKYDSLIFGSSRVGKINPLSIKNANYYNMTYSEGLPREHYLNIQALIKKNIKIKNLIIGLDDFSYQVNPLTHEQQPMRRIHYKASNTNIFNFYYMYLGLLPNLDSIKKKLQCYSNKNNCGFYDFYKTGMPIVPVEIETKIEENVIDHVNNKIFDNPTRYRANYLEKTINDIKMIVKLCKANNINLILFINPIHKTTYIDTNFELFIDFKRQLIDLANYYDFSGFNSVTNNNYFWYETSHYRTIVGNFISAKIFNDKSVEVPEDFGVLVTKDNIDEHLENLRKQIKEYDLNKSILD